MYLEKLEVENIRSIPSVALDFLDVHAPRPQMRRWSLLVGENGTGKSTLLKSAALLLAGSSDLPQLIGDCSSWVRAGKSSGSIRATLRTADWEPRQIELVIAAGDTLRDLLNRNRATLESLDEAIARASQNYFVAAYGPYRRVSDNPSLLSSSSSKTPARAQCLQTLFDKNAVVNPLPSWAMDLEYRRGPEGLQVVRDALNELMPDVSFVGVDKEAKTLRFETPDGVVALEQLSDGYQNVAAWIGDLLYRVSGAFAHHENPLHARGLLLIDEIDAHLHPAWQRKLREFLTTKLPNFQIVATTHSALTLQQAHEGEATILTRDENRLVGAVDFPGDPSKLRLHQLYDLGFKISSLDSWEIEQSKEVYRELSAKAPGSLTQGEQQKLEKAQAALETIPEDRGDSLGNEALGHYFSKLDEIATSLETRALNP